MAQIVLIWSYKANTVQRTVKMLYFIIKTRFAYETPTGLRMYGRNGKRLETCVTAFYATPLGLIGFLAIIPG